MVVKKEKEEKIEISKYIEKSDELINMIEKLRKDKKILFHIYDSLKWFDLIMSTIWKEKLLEYFFSYMKNTEEKQKNYSKFVSFIAEWEWEDFLNQLKETYNWIVINYDKIKFNKKSYHFWNEEIYLRETLEKIKSILEDLGLLKWKKLININLSFLNWKNSNLDFKFFDHNLEEIWFYENLENIANEEWQENLLPFFHLLNNLVEEQSITEERVIEMIKEQIKELQKNIKILEKENEDLEKKSISEAKKELKSYLSKKDIKELNQIIEKTNNILEKLNRNKQLSQSIILKDIDTLTNKFDELQKII